MVMILQVFLCKSAVFIVYLKKNHYPWFRGFKVKWGDNEIADVIFSII